MVHVQDNQSRYDVQDAAVADLIAQLAKILAIVNRDGSASFDSTLCTTVPSILHCGEKSNFAPANTRLHNRSPSNLAVILADGRKSPIVATDTTRLSSTPKYLNITIHTRKGFNKMLLPVSALCKWTNMSFNYERAYVTIPPPPPPTSPIVVITTRRNGLCYMDDHSARQFANRAVSDTLNTIRPPLRPERPEMDENFRRHPPPFQSRQKPQLVSPVDPKLQSIQHVFNHVGPASMARMDRHHPTLVHPSG